MSNTNPPQDPDQPQQSYGSPQSYGSQPGGYGQPQPYGQGYAPVAEDPGKTLGIVGLVVSFFATLIGMIISIVALRRSKKAGFKNTPALIGIIIGALGTLVYVVVGVILIVGLVALGQACQQLGPGTHRVNGTTYTCPG